MRHITLLQYRGGSTLYQKLMRGPIVCGSKYLPTLHQFECPVFLDGATDVLKLVRDRGFENVEWRVWHGDWWGQCDSEGVPAPYTDPTPMSWSYKALAPIIADGWKVLSIVRDGRDWIESTRRFKGGIEEAKQREDPKDYFIYLCKAFRNKGRMIIDARLRFPNEYKIIKMEDLVANPLSTLKEIEAFIEVPLDWNVLQENIDFAATNMNDPSGAPGSFHSSFGDKNFHSRHENQSEEEIKEFYSIAGTEQAELGY